MAMNAYQKAIKKLVGIQPPDPLGTGAATGESIKPSAGAVGGASPSILPGVPGQGTVTKPVGVPGQAQKQNLPQTNTAFKQAVDAVTPANQEYTSFYKPPTGFGAMGAEDRATWNGIGQKYAAGDRSWLTDTNGFRDSGNWGSYTDADGNINGWLMALNGTGGLAPVFGGRVGETGYAPGTVFAGPDGTAYIAGADGILKPSGTVNYATYGKAPGPGDGSLHGTFHASDGKTYNYDELSPEMAAQFGLVNSPGGGAHIGSVPEMTDQALAQGATTPEIAALVREDARMEEQGLPVPGTTVSGSSSGSGSSGSGNVPAGTTPTGTTGNGETSPYKAALDEYDYGKAPEWEGSPYMAERDAALERAKNMEWSYDPNTDPVWQAYQKQYRREGQRAAQDTLGKYAQMTGGLPGSYAANAAAQAGNYYAAQLSDRLPQVYNEAYQRYLQEFQRQMGISDQYAGFDQTEYNRFADTRDQWNADRNFRYGLNRDAVEDARYADETAYSRNYQAQRDAILDSRADREWAQELRAYADAQGWKQAEWQQYLREYGDQLSEQERQWAYQMARDAESDRRYNDETAYQRAMYADETAYDRGRDAVGDERWDTQWQQSIREYDDERRQQEINNAWKRIQATGYISDADAALLGLQPGTYSGSAASSGGRSSGGGYSAGSAESRNGGAGATAETHDNGLPKSSGYDQAWADVQSYARNPSYSKTMVLNYIKSLITRDIISDEEGNMMLLKLGYDKGSGGGGSYAPVSPNNVNMTK